MILSLVYLSTDTNLEYLYDAQIWNTTPIVLGPDQERLQQAQGLDAGGQGLQVPVGVVGAGVQRGDMQSSQGNMLQFHRKVLKKQEARRGRALKVSSWRGAGRQNRIPGAG